ncbi:ATP-binding protein [Bradyrhizobium canariense]|nr:AAA family ATPase [Bradyrhizobium canariense]
METYDQINATSARRRYLTILFSDLSNSAGLAASLEEEDFSDLLNRLRRAYEEIIPKHGGTIVQIRGDGVLASFGYPEAHEDDGRRATEAAIDLHQLVLNLRTEGAEPTSPPLSLHTGIHSGLVLLAEGDDVQGRLSLIGNTVNVAARLSDAAGSGEILVSEETLGADSHFYETTSRRSLQLQGISEPMSVYGVIGRSPVVRRFEARSLRGLTSFVGRITELQALKGSLFDVIRGKPQFVAIVAPAGMGKTRLVEEFLRDCNASECRTLRAYCESYLSAEPLQPFLQILRSLFGLGHGRTATYAAGMLRERLADIDSNLVGLSLEFVRALSLSDPSKSSAAAQKIALDGFIGAICKLFDTLTASRPVVLFVDDWQWADSASRQVLEAIRRLSKPRLFVLVASRELESGNVAVSDATILSLEPFSGEETDVVIRSLLPASNPFTTTMIRERSGGNPLFIEELCHYAAHNTQERRRVRSQSREAWLDKLIEARVERLEFDKIELVRTAAVIGNVIPSWLFERLTGCDEQHPAIAALSAQDLIFHGEQPGTLCFKHGIARDVIYNSVGSRQRKSLHKRIADTLREHNADEELCELLAYHYGACGQSAEAAQYAEAAGDKAVATSALDRAQMQYSAALAALDPDVSHESYERWLNIAQRLALACVFDPSRDHLELLRRAVTLATARNDLHAVARAEYWVGYIHYALGDLRLSTHHLESSLMHAAKVSDEPLAVQIRATLGQAFAAASEYDRALILLDEAIAIKRQYRKPGRPAVAFAYSLACKGSVLGDQGHFAEAHVCFLEALEGIRDSGHEVEGSILCWDGAVNLWQGRWEAARLSAAKARNVAERVKSLYLYGQSVSITGYATWMMHRSQHSLPTIIDATSWLENQNRGLFISLNYGWITECLVDSERWQEARRYAGRALHRSRQMDQLGAAAAYRALARSAIVGRARATPEHYLALAMNNALRRRARHEIAVTQLCNAEMSAARGEHKAAGEMLDSAEQLFEAMKMEWHIEVVRALRKQC